MNTCKKDFTISFFTKNQIFQKDILAIIHVIQVCGGDYTNCVHGEGVMYVNYTAKNDLRRLIASALLENNTDLFYKLS